MYGEEFLTLLKKVLELVYQHKAMLISKAEEREKYMQQVAMFLNNLSKRGELSRLEKRIPAYKRKFYRYIKKLSESMNLQKNTKPQVT
jgi:predicted nuclease with TOPRIM domain